MWSNKRRMQIFMQINLHANYGRGLFICNVLQIATHVNLQMDYEVCFQDGPLGLGLSDLNEVVELDPTGQAYQAQCIRIGDQLLTIGGVTTNTLDEAAIQFQQQTRPMILKFRQRDALHVGEGNFGTGSDVLTELRNYFQSIDFLQTVEEFCLDHCDPFDDDDEMLLIYTEIFESFKSLFENRIENFVTSRGVSLEEFYGLCKESNIDNDNVSDFLDMIYGSFQFESFVDLMRGQKRKKDRLGDPRYMQEPPPPPPPLIDEEEREKESGQKYEGKTGGNDNENRRK